METNNILQYYFFSSPNMQHTQEFSTGTFNVHTTKHTNSYGILYMRKWRLTIELQTIEATENSINKGVIAEQCSEKPISSMLNCFTLLQSMRNFLCIIIPTPLACILKSGTKINKRELLCLLCTHCNSRQVLKDSWKLPAINKMLIYFTCDRWCILCVKWCIIISF